MSASNKLCPIPFIHLNIVPDGDVRMCCVDADFTVVGNINDSPKDLSPFYNSKFITEVRGAMMRGEEHTACRKCYFSETVANATGEPGMSNRIAFQETFPLTMDEAKEMLDDEYKMKPGKFKYRYWDFRFSNLCNYKCRSCGPQFSSAIDAEYNKFEPENRYIQPHLDKKTKVFTIKNTTTDNADNAVDLIGDLMSKHLDEVDEIYFAGGEPLLMPEHWKLLQDLIDKGRTNVRIRYNFNVSTMDYQKTSIESLWSHFDKVVINPSLDDLGSRAEYIRSGTNWKKVMDNLQRLVAFRDGRGDQSADKYCLLYPNITVTNFTAPYVAELLEWLFRQRVMLHPTDFSVNPVYSPEHMHVRNMTPSSKLETLKSLRAFQEKYASYDLSKLDLIIANMRQRPNDDEIMNLAIRTRKLDERRNENVNVTYPHIAELIKHK